MTTLRTAPRILTSLSALALSIGALTGCTPEPEHTPTPTAAFASEEEAFTAAEEVYREYVAALNAIDPTDPETFEPVFALSSGSFQKADRKNLSEMYAEGHKIEGSSRVVSFRGDRTSVPYEEIHAVACLDVHDVKITDSEGVSLVSPNRPDVYTLDVTFVIDDQALLINAAERIEDPECTGP